MNSIIYVDTSLNARWVYKSAEGERPDPAIEPYVVRIAWIVDDGASDPLVERCHLIEVPVVVRMTEEASRETGIFDHTDYDRRTSLKGAMTEFCEDLGTASRIVGYNLWHQLAVLDNSISFRLGWPLRPWPNTGCAQDAARKLATHDDKQRAADNNMTLTGKPGQYLKFAVATQRFANMDITPRFNPIIDGYRRVWAVRAIWLKYLELKEA